MMRTPGILGCVSGAAPPDSGTLALRASEAPGVAGTARSSPLSRSDQDLIGQTVGRDLGGALLPLAVLQLRRHQHLARLQEARRHQGDGSWTAAFETAVLQRLDELIAHAASPLGQATERVVALLNDDEAGKTVTDQQFQQAVQDLLSQERQRQLLGGPEDDQLAPPMELVGRVLDVAGQRRNDELERLLNKSEQPGSPFPEKALQEAIAAALGAERQKQLLGKTTDDPQSQRVSALVQRALSLGGQRKAEALRSLIDRARQPGSAVSEAQMQQAVSELLGMERQRQLLGGEGGEPAMGLVQEAAQVMYLRRSQALQQAYDRKSSPAEIARAEADYEAAKASLRQLGVNVAEGSLGNGALQINPGPPRR